MVLEEYHLRLTALRLLVLLDPVVYLLEEGVSGIGILDIKSVREQFCTFGGSID